MTVPTTPGETYAITASAPCTVTAAVPGSAPLLLLTIVEPGQYLIVAPSASLEISDPSALVTRSFRGAPACLTLRTQTAGGAIGTEETEQILSGTAEDNLNAPGFSFKADQTGSLTAVSIRGRSTMGFHHNPVWLKAWKKTEAGRVLLGLTAKSVIQQNNALNKWTFPEGVTAASGDTLILTSHGEDTKDDTSYAMENSDFHLLARVAAIPHTPDTGCLNASGEPAWDYLPHCTLTYAVPASLALYARVLPVSPETFESLAHKRPQTLYFIMETQP